MHLYSSLEELLRSIMKASIENRSSRDLLNGVSTSGSLSDDTDLAEKSLFHGCLPCGFNLNFAMMVLAEMVGTFILIYCISGIVASMEVMGVKMGLLEYATAAGSAVVVIVFSIGAVSGVHINPAVTIAFATFGHFPWSKVPFYLVAQLVGSVLAAYAGMLVYGVKPELLTTHPTQGCAAAFWAEFMSTFLIMLLAVSLARDHKSVGRLSGFVMGIGIALGVLISGPISGGSMNPARSLGPAIVSGKFNHIWIYLFAPTAGAIVGVLVVHLFCIQHQITSPS
ncbi:hypothetical protein Nepgr_020653 [Nepenthes gracilis]|uniref:Aquaporin NIP7-1 n=1 Tax=Nepenthes gracilis TaxID=150966 RepID=A0AAD3SYE1_NEPGR|nr:hypothetical protein Nepgr_020653 [Nepenthes gracilis]